MLLAHNIGRVGAMSPFWNTVDRVSITSGSSRGRDCIRVVSLEVRTQIVVTFRGSEFIADIGIRGQVGLLARKVLHFVLLLGTRL